MLFVGPQPSMGHRYALMQRTDPHRRDAVQLRFQPAKLASAARTTRSLPLPVLTSFRRGGLPTRPLISPPLLAVFDNKELDPPTHRACGSSSVNESLKWLLTSLRLPPVVVILTRWWWFLFIFVHHFGIVLRWAIVVAALLRKRAT